MITAQSKLVYRKKKAYQQIYMKYPQTMNREKLEKDIWDQVEITPPAKRRNGTLNKAIQRIPQPSSLYNKN